VTGEGFAQQPRVLGRRLRIGLGTELVQQPGRALDVGKKKGDRAARKLVMHAP
jgi:hypothetical protein